MTADTFDPTTVAWVMDQRDLGYLSAAIASAEEVVIDLETTGLDEHATTGGPRNGGVAARVSLASLTLPQEDDAGEPTTWVLPLSHPDSPWLGQWRAVLRALAHTLRQERKALVNQNIKFDLRWIYALTGVDLSGLISWDTRVASHLLDENVQHSLKVRVPEEFGVPPWNDHDLSYPGASEDVPLIDLGLYAARDTYWTWRWARAQRERMFLIPGADDPWDPEEVQDARLGTLAVYCAMPTTATLTAVEQRGICLDVEWVRARIEEHEKERQRLHEALSGLYASESLRPEDASFAPTSHWFMAWAEAAVLAGDLRVAALTPNGRPQWSKGVLARQARNGSQVAADLLDMRGYIKRLEYLRSWLEYVTPAGRIHANYNVGSVVTGRLSSSEPNMQQVTRSLRPAFVARPGYVLIDIDYSQIELRIAAFISRCEPMLAAFADGRDLHSMFAARITGKSEEEITGDDRQKGKCFHPDTEVLTRSGWKKIPALKPGEEVMQGVPQSDGTMGLEWAAPWQVYTQPNEHDHLVHLQAEGMDLIVTPDHAMLAQSRNGTWREVLPEDMPSVRYWPNAGIREGESWEVSEDLLRLAVAIQADASYLGGGRTRWGFKKPWKADRLRDLLHRTGTAYTERVTSQGATEFRVEYTEAVTLLDDDKTLPWTWLNLPERLREVILEEARWWDGTQSSGDAGSYRYSSSVQKNIDVLQALAAITGRKAHDYGDGRLSIRRKWRTRGGNLKVTRLPYTGEVACLAVPSGVVLVRHGGVVHVTKQSANFGLLYGMEAEGFQTYSEDVYGVVLSAEEAAEIREAYFDMWVGLREWHASAVQRAQRTGQVTSPIGRVRRLPDIDSYSERRRLHAERQAINAPVQGFASDIMQIAAASIEGTLPGSAPVPGAAIVATVHDSLLVEAPEDRWEEVRDACVERMTQEVPRLLQRHFHVTLDVPLVADASAGRRWGTEDL